MNSPFVYLFAFRQHLVCPERELCGPVCISRVRLSFVSCCAALQGAAELVGKRIGELCLERKISAVSFDRGGNIYHGRVQVRVLPIFWTAPLCWVQGCIIFLVCLMVNLLFAQALAEAARAAGLGF